METTKETLITRLEMITKGQEKTINELKTLNAKLFIDRTEKVCSQGEQPPAPSPVINTVERLVMKIEENQIVIGSWASTIMSEV